MVDQDTFQTKKYMTLFHRDTFLLGFAKKRDVIPLIAFHNV